MNKVVYKYVLKAAGMPRLNLPKGTKFLHAGLQEHEICVWCEVDPYEDELIEYEVFCVGTGWPFKNPDAQHIGTTITESGFVWHFYVYIVKE